MIRALSALSSVLIMVSACGPSSPPDPEERRLLTEVLVEMHLAHARANLGHGLLQSKDSLLTGYGLDSVAFNRLVEKHIDSDGAFNDAYEQVLDRLSEERHRQSESDDIGPPGVR